ncbi:MAG TPA: dienelactone hydrolase, partial [Candidatus Sericytochromatia bacterium]
MINLKIYLFKGKSPQNSAKKPQLIKNLQLNLRMLPLKRLAIIKRFVKGSQSSLLWSATVTSLSFASLLSSFVATPALAAEKLILRLGPFQQSVNVADLDS